MASKFDKAKSAQGVREVAKASNEKANLITIKYFKDEDLLDYPRNNEDIEYTEDIESSIEEQGFTDPMEITDCGAPEGKYYIISGHRRRSAGRKKGMKEFPCIVRHFKSDTEVYNYVLHSNSHRDSAKDPLLYAKRYKMHEEYLKEAGFKGSIAEEVAKRLGLKKAQADRYKQMNKVILPIWDMIRDGRVGMSSITDSGLYTHTPEEQEEILNIFNECIENGVELTRATATKIVKGYREGKRTWLEVIQIEMNNKIINPSLSNEVGVSVMSVNTEPEEPKEQEERLLDRNNEVNYDYSHREGLESGVDPYAGERLTDEDVQAIEKSGQNEEKNKEPKELKPKLTDEEKKVLAGEKIMKHFSDLEGLLNNFYTFNDNELALKTIGSAMMMMIQEMDALAEENDLQEVCEKQLNKVIDTINGLK